MLTNDQAGVAHTGMTERVAIVTGAASGIGRQTAQMLADLGTTVVAIDRLSGELQAVVAGLRPIADSNGETIRDHRSVVGDLAEQGVAEQALQIAIGEYGRLDVVVFSAGSPARGQLADVDDEEFDSAFRDNVKVHFRLTRAILQAARRGQWNSKNTCSLVYVGSKHAVAPSSGFGAYPLAKSAEMQLAQLTALEGAAFGIRANTVNPGAVFQGSRFWSPELIAEKAAQHRVSPQSLEDYYARRNLLGKSISPRDVAAAICFFASPLSGATTGAVISVDGGLSASFAR